MSKMPQVFWEWAFVQRADFIRKMMDNQKMDEREIYLGFTRHTPAMVTNGPAGLNASIKGFGFVPRQEYIEKVTSALNSEIEEKESKPLKALWDNIYSPEASKNIDRTRLISLELARKHTFENVSPGKTQCTLIYYQPPMVSFEVRGEVELACDDKIIDFANAIHDVYHKRPKGSKKNLAYTFFIREVFDNSVSSFGKRLDEGLEDNC